VVFLHNTELVGRSLFVKKGAQFEGEVGIEAREALRDASYSLTPTEDKKYKIDISNSYAVSNQ
jgi:hypothetical protein